MPKNNVSDLITDQEITFGRLILSGTMTDRRAAEAAGLNPDTAAYIKSKPRVRAYMLEHRAAVEKQLIEQETQELRRCSLVRDRVLARLWEIADLDPEMTRNSPSAQVKALSMIIAIEGLIPPRTNDRRAVAAQNESAPPPVTPPFYVSEWMRTRQHGESVDPQPPATQEGAAPEPQSAPGGVDDPTPMQLSSRPEESWAFGPPELMKTSSCSATPLPEATRPERSEVEGPAVHAPLNPSQTTSSLPRVPMADYVAPDTRRPFSIDKNRFGRRR
jgi:hypothetical protein